MATDTVNGWMLGVDLDDKPFRKKAKAVEKVFDKLNSKQFTAADTYQTMLSKQLATLNKIERVTKRVQGQPVTPVRGSPARGKSSGGKIAGPYSSLPTRRRFEDLQYGLKSDVENLGSRVAVSLNGNSSLDSIQGRIVKIKNGLNEAADSHAIKKLRKDFQLLNAEVRRTESGVRAVNRAQHKATFVSRGLSSSLNNLGRSFASVYLAMQAVGTTYRVMKQLSSVKATLLAAAGGAAQATQDFEFLRETSMRLGVGLLSSAKGYAQLGVAAKEAGLGAAKAKELFIASSEASVAFGMSADDSYGMIRSLVQMLSKGQVMAEELKTQMGDRMPIAVGIMAKAVGVSKKELIKMMETGQLASEEVLPNFAKALREVAREGGALAAGMKSIQAEENRFGTSIDSAIESFSKGGGEEGLTSLMRLVSESIAKLDPFFKGLGALFGLIAKVIKPIGRMIYLTVLPPLTLLGDTLVFISDKLDVMFGKFEEGGKSLSLFDKYLNNIGMKIKTLIAPIRVLIEYLDILSTVSSREGLLSTAWNRLARTSKAEDMDKEIKARMYSRVTGTALPSSITNKSASTTNNNNITYNVKSSDPKGVVQEIDNYNQQMLGTSAVPDF